MNRSEITNAIEAMLFAAGDPLSFTDIGKIFDRLWSNHPKEEREALKRHLGQAIDDLKERWDDGSDRGFSLTEVADGLAFRTNSRFADALKAMREQRPVRLSRAALETLAIIAYRQPVTKPEIEHIRGVDCSATLRLLLDRSLVRILGKKEEPGLPLLYGTSREFLSFFNLSNLAQLPTLREYHELTEDSREELDSFDTQMGLDDLREAAQRLRPEEEPAVHDLEQAVSALKSTEKVTRGALAEQGIELEEPKAEDPQPQTGDDTPQTAERDAPPGAGVEQAPPTEGVPASAEGEEAALRADEGETQGEESADHT
ncbi:SMC-Scp complex subunit ScpB [Myxococcota bacterium]